MTKRARVLLLGGTGYVGSAIRSELERRDIYHGCVSRQECDYFDVDSLCAVFEREQPSFLINAAGYTGKPNVDACEENKLDCLRLNAVLPGVVRDACERFSLPWGHVSSGCIYTGQRADDGGFNEEDPPNFTFRQGDCSFYSGTKALGEEALLSARQCYVWRLRMPFHDGSEPRNYLTKLLTYERLLDVRNSLSHLHEFSRACVDSWTAAVPYGIYNLTNGGSITTREIVELLQASGLATHKLFSFFKSEQQFMSDVAVAKRSSCVLDNAKALDAGIRLRHVREAVAQSIAALKECG